MVGKMTELKPISHKEFNAFIKGKGFKNRGKYTLTELKAQFGFRPLVKRIGMVISSEDMDPTTFDSINQAATSLGVGHMVIRYTRKNGRDTFKWASDGKVFLVNWR